MYICYEHSMYVSHIRIYAYHGYVTQIKGQKYLMFVDTRKVDFLVDKSQFNFILFTTFLFIHLLIPLFINFIQ